MNEYSMYFDSPEVQSEATNAFERVSFDTGVSAADLITWHERAVQSAEQFAAACRKAVEAFLRWVDEYIFQPLGQMADRLMQSLLETWQQFSRLIDTIGDRPEPLPLTKRPSHKPHILPIHIPDPVRAGRSPIWSRR